MGPTSEPRRHVSLRLTSALAAALWLETCLTPAALGADPSDQICPQQSPLGGWVRMQHLAQTRDGDGGCDQVTNVFMTFDLVFDGPSFEWLVARLPPQIPPRVRQKMVTDMLAARVGLQRKATKLTYKIWTSGCHPVGGPDFTCSGPGGAGAGELTLGEATPTGFKEIDAKSPGSAGGGVWGFGFDPMVPSLQLGASTASNDKPLLHPSGVSCRGPNGSGSGLGSNSDGSEFSGGFDALGFTIEPDPNCTNSTGRSFCTPPTACFQPTDVAQRKECVSNPGKFAALPFEGKAERRYSQWHDEGIVFTKISWKACCGCGQESPPDFPNEPQSAQSTDPVMATHSTTWTIANDTAANWTLHSSNLAQGVWKSSPPQTIANGAKASFTAESHDPMTGDQGSVVYTPVLTPVPLANVVFSFDNPSIGTDSYTVLVPSPFSEQTTQQTGNNQVLTSTVK